MPSPEVLAMRAQRIDAELVGLWKQYDRHVQAPANDPVERERLRGNIQTAILARYVGTL